MIKTLTRAFAAWWLISFITGAVEGWREAGGTR